MMGQREQHLKSVVRSLLQRLCLTPHFCPSDRNHFPNCLRTDRRQSNVIINRKGFPFLTFSKKIKSCRLSKNKKNSTSYSPTLLQAYQYIEQKRRSLVWSSEEKNLLYLADFCRELIALYGENVVHKEWYLRALKLKATLLCLSIEELLEQQDDFKESLEAVQDENLRMSLQEDFRQKIYF